MRRILAMAFLWMAAGSVSAWENEAETLFRTMQDKVRAAKTLRVRSEINLTGALGRKWNVKVLLLLGQGQMYRAEGDGKMFGQAVKFVEVSDGINTSYRDLNDPKRSITEKAEKNAGVYYRSALPRDGFLIGSLNMKQRSEWPQDDFQVSNFKLEGQEKVGERDARVISFTVAAKGKDAMPVKLWLDSETKLPVKLLLTGGKSDIRDVTETYSEFGVDAPVDAKLFELPQ